MPSGTLYRRLKEIALKYPLRPPIQYKKDNKWINFSYDELIRDIESLASFLLEEGIEKGDRIAIMLENRPQWPMIFFASAYIGAILVTINPEMGEKEITDLLTDSGCKMLFVGGKAKYHFIKKVISVDSDEFNKALEKPLGQIKTEKVNPDDTACIVYTSGTTDQPKGVMLTHRNFLSNSDSVFKMNLGDYRDSIVSVLPLDQNYPMTVTMVLPLTNGLSVIYPGSMSVENVLKAMRESKPTVFVGVPQVFNSFYKGILEELKNMPVLTRVLVRTVAEILYGVKKLTGFNAARYAFFNIHRKLGGAIRFYISGGAKLDESVAIGMAKFGFTILEGYGLSETSPVLTLNPLKRQKPGSAGVAIPDVEIRIYNKNEKGIGEVIVRGPNIMKGYYKRDDLTAEVIRDGWLYTGDLGWIDKDGYLFLTGRSKDIIVLSWGINIYPEEIEKAYLNEVPLKEICVFDTPPRRGVRENIALWAACVPDGEFLKKHEREDLRDALKGKIENVSRKLPHYKRIMGFTITSEPLQRTLLGKVKRYTVKEFYASNLFEKEEYMPKPKKFSKEDLDLMQKDIAKKIINFLKEKTQISDISPQDSFELDLGIDFLGRIELASGLEKTLNRKIEDEVVRKAFTVKDLIEGVKE